MEKIKEKMEGIKEINRFKILLDVLVVNTKILEKLVDAIEIMSTSLDVMEKKLEIIDCDDIECDTSEEVIDMTELRNS